MKRHSKHIYSNVSFAERKHLSLIRTDVNCKIRDIMIEVNDLKKKIEKAEKNRVEDQNDAFELLNSFKEIIEQQREDDTQKAVDSMSKTFDDKLNSMAKILVDFAKKIEPSINGVKKNHKPVTYPTDKPKEPVTYGEGEIGKHLKASAAHTLAKLRGWLYIDTASKFFAYFVSLIIGFIVVILTASTILLAVENKRLHSLIQEHIQETSTILK